MISFGLGLVFFVLGTAIVGLCIMAIPSPGNSESAAGPSHGHSAH